MRQDPWGARRRRAQCSAKQKPALRSHGREASGHNVGPAVQLSRLARAHVATEAVNPLTSRVCDHEVHCLTGQNRALIVGLRDE